MAAKSPPLVYLSVDGGARHPGERGSYYWNNGPVWEPGGLVIPASALDVPARSTIDLAIDGDVCAVGWYIVYGTVPDQGPGPTGFLVVGELVPREVNRDPDYASQNKFAFAAPPVGDWLVEASLGFVHGEETAIWRIDVK